MADPVFRPGFPGSFLTTVALRRDGTVWEWGAYVGSATPAKVEGLTDVVAVAAGPDRSDWVRRGLAVKADGTVWEWEETASSPAQVGGLTGVTRVAAGGFHSLALKEDGTVWAWGSNDRGQLGDGTTQDRPAPVQVAGLTGVVGIAAAGSNSLALKTDKTVWAWGDNFMGQLGDVKIRSMFRTPAPVIQPGSPDLAIEMSHDGDFAAGSQGIYTLVITNTGLTATTGMVTVTDTLPPGLTFASGTGSGWICWPADRIVTCANPGPIEPGGPSVITLTVNVVDTAWPGVTNLAIVHNESDRNSANNVAGDPTVVLSKPPE